MTTLHDTTGLDAAMDLQKIANERAAIADQADETPGPTSVLDMAAIELELRVTTLVSVPSDRDCGDAYQKVMQAAGDFLSVHRTIRQATAMLARA